MEGLAHILEQHTRALEENNRLLERMIEALAFQQREWYTPEEVKQALGFPPTPSGKSNASQSAKLKWLRNKGYLHSYIDGRPIMYNAENVREVADKLRRGKIHIPSKIY